MNVTIKMDDSLCKAARHRAVEAGQSLSAWLADLVRRETSRSGHGEDARESLLDLLGDKRTADRHFDVPRLRSPQRDVTFDQEPDR